MKAVEVDGWPQVRHAVFRRDVGCVATQWRIFGGDIAPDGCKDAFGAPMEWDDWALLEWDHVTQHNVRYDDEAHGVAVCPWHHRLSQRWRCDSKKHRERIREYLANWYPEVWHASP